MKAVSLSLLVGLVLLQPAPSCVGASSPLARSRQSQGSSRPSPTPIPSPQSQTPASQQAQPPRVEVSDPARLTAAEIAALVDECGRLTSRMTGRLYSYTFNEADYEYEQDKAGRVVRERWKLYEVAPVRAGRRYRWVHVQVGEDGAAFPEEKIARERERVAKQLAEDERDAARTPTPQPAPTPTPAYARYSSYGIRLEKRGSMSRTYWYVGATHFLVWHEFYAPRRATYKGREAILLNFRPRPGYVFDETNVPFKEGLEDFGRVMSQLGGRLWIDAADRVIVRLEAAPFAEAQAAGDAADGRAPLGYEFTRLDSGAWVPLVTWYNSYGREGLFWKTAASRALKYSNFKLFTTNAGDEKLDAPPKP